MDCQNEDSEEIKEIMNFEIDKPVYGNLPFIQLETEPSSSESRSDQLISIGQAKGVVYEPFLSLSNIKHGSALQNSNEAFLYPSPEHILDTNLFLSVSPDVFKFPPLLAASREIDLDRVVHYARMISQKTYYNNHPIGGVIFLRKEELLELKQMLISLSSLQSSHHFSLSSDQSSSESDQIQEDIRIRLRRISNFIILRGSGILTIDGVHRALSCKLLIELLRKRNSLPPIQNSIFSDNSLIDLNEDLGINFYSNTVNSFEFVNTLCVVYDASKVIFNDKSFLRALSLIGAKRNRAANDVQKYDVIHLINQYIRIPLENLLSQKYPDFILKGYSSLPKEVTTQVLSWYNENVLGILSEHKQTNLSQKSIDVYRQRLIRLACIPQKPWNFIKCIAIKGIPYQDGLEQRKTFVCDSFTALADFAYLKEFQQDFVYKRFYDCLKDGSEPPLKVIVNDAKKIKETNNNSIQCDASNSLKTIQTYCFKKMIPLSQSSDLVYNPLPRTRKSIALYSSTPNLRSDPIQESINVKESIFTNRDDNRISVNPVAVRALDGFRTPSDPHPSNPIMKFPFSAPTSITISTSRDHGNFGTPYLPKNHDDSQFTSFSISSVPLNISAPSSAPEILKSINLPESNNQCNKVRLSDYLIQEDSNFIINPSNHPIFDRHSFMKSNINLIEKQRGFYGFNGIPNRVVVEDQFGCKYITSECLAADGRCALDAILQEFCPSFQLSQKVYDSSGISQFILNGHLDVPTSNLFRETLNRFRLAIVRFYNICRSKDGLLSRLSEEFWPEKVEISMISNRHSFIDLTVEEDNSIEPQKTHVDNSLRSLSKLYGSTNAGMLLLISCFLDCPICLLVPSTISHHMNRQYFLYFDKRVISNSHAYEESESPIFSCRPEYLDPHFYLKFNRVLYILFSGNNHFVYLKPISGETFSLCSFYSYDLEIFNEAIEKMKKYNNRDYYENSIPILLNRLRADIHPSDMEDNYYLKDYVFDLSNLDEFDFDYPLNLNQQDGMFIYHPQYFQTDKGFESPHYFSYRKLPNLCVVKLHSNLRSFYQKSFYEESFFISQTFIGSNSLIECLFQILFPSRMLAYMNYQNGRYLLGNQHFGLLMREKLMRLSRDCVMSLREALLFLIGFMKTKQYEKEFFEFLEITKYPRGFNFDKNYAEDPTHEAGLEFLIFFSQLLKAPILLFDYDSDKSNIGFEPFGIFDHTNTNFFFLNISSESIYKDTFYSVFHHKFSRKKNIFVIIRSKQKDSNYYHYSLAVPMDWSYPGNPSVSELNNFLKKCSEIKRSSSPFKYFRENFLDMSLISFFDPEEQLYSSLPVHDVNPLEPEPTEDKESETIRKVKSKKSSKKSKGTKSMSSNSKDKNGSKKNPVANSETRSNSIATYASKRNKKVNSKSIKEICPIARDYRNFCNSNEKEICDLIGFESFKVYHFILDDPFSDVSDWIDSRGFPSSMPNKKLKIPLCIFSLDVTNKSGRSQSHFQEKVRNSFLASAEFNNLESFTILFTMPVNNIDELDVITSHATILSFLKNTKSIHIHEKYRLESYFHICVVPYSRNHSSAEVHEYHYHYFLKLSFRNRKRTKFWNLEKIIEPYLMSNSLPIHWDKFKNDDLIVCVNSVICLLLLYACFESFDVLNLIKKEKNKGKLSDLERINRSEDRLYVLCSGAEMEFFQTIFVFLSGVDLISLSKEIPIKCYSFEKKLIFQRYRQACLFCHSIINPLISLSQFVPYHHFYFREDIPEKNLFSFSEMSSQSSISGFCNHLFYIPIDYPEISFTLERIEKNSRSSFNFRSTIVKLQIDSSSDEDLDSISSNDEMERQSIHEETVNEKKKLEDYSENSRHDTEDISMNIDSKEQIVHALSITAVNETNPNNSFESNSFDSVESSRSLSAIPQESLMNISTPSKEINLTSNSMHNFNFHSSVPSSPNLFHPDFIPSIDRTSYQSPLFRINSSVTTSLSATPFQQSLNALVTSPMCLDAISISNKIKSMQPTNELNSDTGTSISNYESSMLISSTINDNANSSAEIPKPVAIPKPSIAHITYKVNGVPVSTGEVRENDVLTVGVDSTCYFIVTQRKKGVAGKHFSFSAAANKSKNGFGIVFHFPKDVNTRAGWGISFWNFKPLESKDDGSFLENGTHSFTFGADNNHLIIVKIHSRDHDELSGSNSTVRKLFITNNDHDDEEPKKKKRRTNSKLKIK